MQGAGLRVRQACDTGSPMPSPEASGEGRSVRVRVSNEEEQEAMTGLVRRVRRSVALSAMLTALLAGAVACTGDDDGESPEGDEPGSSASDLESEPIHTTVQRISGRLDKARRDEVKAGVNEVVDGWFEGAFLGEFPRTDYKAAFAGFTKGARKDALANLPLLSNQEIDAKIDSAVAGNRRVRLDVLAPQGQPHGVTAHFVLDFFTHGELEDHLRVQGSLYLIEEEGKWRIFGYDVVGAHKR